MTQLRSQAGPEVSPPQPLYIEGSLGPLYCLHHAPANGAPPHGCLLFLPPFAEEANCSRRMAVLQARRLAERGWAVLLLDPFGTGDSAGGFDEARWEGWLSDAGVAADWLARRWPESSVVLWGLRLGALLAAALAARYPQRFTRLLFWQPVQRGDQFLAQFLRLRIAAAMASGGKENGQSLRAKLADGEVLEIAGYEMAPQLAMAIEEQRLAFLLGSLEGARVDWLEVTAAAGDPDLTPASRRLLQDLPEPIASAITARAVPGEPFWAIQETTLAPQLLDATDALFA